MGVFTSERIVVEGHPRAGEGAKVGGTLAPVRETRAARGSGGAGQKYTGLGTPVQVFFQTGGTGTTRKVV
jgi:hypothetical protein